MSLKHEREPLMDVISLDDAVIVIAEIPSVSKEHIRVTATENNITLDTETPERKYHKETELPEAIEPNSAKSTYRNGILEITFKRRKKKESGVSIKVE
ncbi:MAG: HSP20 family protein [Candidatus Nitrosomirales archaeon]|jgi:HSP20 family protein